MNNQNNDELVNLTYRYLDYIERTSHDSASLIARYFENIQRSSNTIENYIHDILRTNNNSNIRNRETNNLRQSNTSYRNSRRRRNDNDNLNINGPNNVRQHNMINNRRQFNVNDNPPASLRTTVPMDIVNMMNNLTSNLNNDISNNQYSGFASIFSNVQNNRAFPFIYDNINIGNMTPVPIVPSQEQINNATETTEYNVNSIRFSGQSICPITQEEFVNGERIVLIKNCGHIFKQTAISTWFNGNVTCPTCRRDIRETSNANASEDLPYNGVPSFDISLNDVTSNTTPSPTLIVNAEYHTYNNDNNTTNDNNTSNDNDNDNAN